MPAAPMTDTLLEITDATSGWEGLIARHLAAGDLVEVRIETPSMSPSQAARSLNVSRSSIQKWIVEGRTAAARRGAYYRIPKAEVERFRAERIAAVVDDSRDEIMTELFGQ